MIVAIHQPNYIPWLGFFHKLKQADHFVFLDDVQFSKQSYINRVRILGHGDSRWLTQPIHLRFGQHINMVAPARADWHRAHLDTLRGFYANADAFNSVWADIQALYTDLPADNIASINDTLIKRLAAKLGIGAKFCRSSELETGCAQGDDRLVNIVTRLSPGGTYLSGKGGANYQDECKFNGAGISLVYSDFEHPAYNQNHQQFVAGLSILDAVFHLGWDGAAALIRT